MTQFELRCSGRLVYYATKAEQAARQSNRLFHVADQASFSRYDVKFPVLSEMSRREGSHNRSELDNLLMRGIKFANLAQAHVAKAKKLQLAPQLLIDDTELATLQKRLVEAQSSLYRLRRTHLLLARNDRRTLNEEFELPHAIVNKLVRAGKDRVLQDWPESKLSAAIVHVKKLKKLIARHQRSSPNETIKEI